MSIIHRVTKVGSGTEDFKPGTTIFSGEVNTDFNRMYDDYDGHVTNDNIAPGAGIVYSKLNLTNGIVNADINTNAGILGSKLADAPNGITTTKINDGAVTIAKMAVGAATRSFQAVDLTPIIIVGSASESPPLGTINVTTSGAPALCTIGLEWAASATYVTGLTGSNMRLRLKVDGTTMFDRQYILRPDPSIQLLMPVWLPCPTFLDVLAPAGPHVVTFTIEPGDVAQTFNLISGKFNFVEFA